MAVKEAEAVGLKVYSKDGINNNKVWPLFGNYTEEKTNNERPFNGPVSPRCKVFLKNENPINSRDSSYSKESEINQLNILYVFT